MNERDERLLMMALLFHPNRDEKLGPGFQGIKVNHPKKKKKKKLFICFLKNIIRF